jgi:predicted transcriptional regulator YdeE
MITHIMSHTTTTLDEFTIAGISVRTTNENGKAANDIGALWQRFFSENVIDKIDNKVSDDIYCIYTDYESDFTGAYTTIIGCKVIANAQFSGGLIVRKVPSSTYQLYKSTGRLPDTVLATWQEIWQSSIERNYIADFDVYGEGCRDPDNAVVETYVSVKIPPVVSLD